MKQFFLTKILFLTIILAIFFSGSALAFTELDGKKTTVEEQVGHGKWSVVEIWASDCHACRQHMPEMVKFNGKMANLRLLGISLDGQRGKLKTKAMIKEYGIPFKTILSNPIEVNAWMELVAKEGLIGTPTFMIFDPNGTLVGLQPGQLSVKSMEKFIRSRSKS